MEELMKYLSPHFRCIAPCLRGHGFSSIQTRLRTFYDMVKDLKFFLKELGISKYYVCGHSMGGGVALMIASMFRRSIKGLLLVSSMNPEGASFKGFTAKHKSPEDLKKQEIRVTFEHIIRNQQYDLYVEKFIKPIGKLPQPLTNKDYYMRWMTTVGRFRDPYDLMWCLSKYNWKIM